HQPRPQQLAQLLVGQPGRVAGLVRAVNRSQLAHRPPPALREVVPPPSAGDNSWRSVATKTPGGAAGTAAPPPRRRIGGSPAPSGRSTGPAGWPGRWSAG